jgi:hypothetical protein
MSFAFFKNQLACFVESKWRAGKMTAETLSRRQEGARLEICITSRKYWI